MIRFRFFVLGQINLKHLSVYFHFFFFFFYKNENTGEPSSKTGVFEFERIHEGDFKKKYEMSNKEPLHEL